MCPDSCRISLYAFYLRLCSWPTHRSWVLLSLNFLLVCWSAGTYIYLCIFSTYDLIRVPGIEYHHFHGQCSACHSWSTFGERKKSVFESWTTAAGEKRTVNSILVHIRSYINTVIKGVQIALRLKEASLELEGILVSLQIKYVLFFPLVVEKQMALLKILAL